MFTPFANEDVLFPVTASAVVVAPVNDAFTPTRLLAKKFVEVACVEVLRTMFGRKNKVARVSVALMRASARAAVKYRLFPSVSAVVVVAYHAASARYEFKSENCGRPSEEVAACVQVFPAPPMRSWFCAMVLRPVPPRTPESVPTHDGVRVWVAPEETMVRLMLASVPVAKDCVSAVRPLSEEMPVLVATHAPPTEKHPAVRLIPFAKDEVELPMMLSALAETPEKVEVAVEVAMKRLATTSPTTLSFAYGDEVPRPKLPLFKNDARVTPAALRSRMLPLPC